MRPQPSILAPIPASGRFLVLGLRPGADGRGALARLADTRLDGIVVGVGLPLAPALAGLRAFPGIAGPGVAYPSTQGALWAFIGGAEAGATLLAARALLARAGGDFVVEEDVHAFKHDAGRDLSGYEDGTENPKGDAAATAALAPDGSSFVAVQRWVHDLARLEALAPAERDAIIGRARATNEELPDAPSSAHIKRTAQESFTPTAFMLRRSMPYGTVSEHGFYFVAYGRTLDAFERMLRRMAGLDDGIVDGLSRFTRAVSGGYYWCPPLGDDGRLDLGALG